MLALHKILVKKDKTREKLDFYMDTLEQFFNSYNMPFCNIFFYKPSSILYATNESTLCTRVLNDFKRTCSPPPSIKFGPLSPHVTGTTTSLLA